MSRYILPTEHTTLEVVLGWDPGLDTYFSQVFDLTAPDDADNCLWWVGTTPHAICTVHDLQERLSTYVGVTIPEALRTQLREDHRTSPLLTPLQQQMWRLCGHTT